MRGHSPGRVLEASCVALLVACSSSSSSPTTGTKSKDAATDSHHAAVHDAAKVEPRPDAGAPDDSGTTADSGADAGLDSGTTTSHDAHVAPHDASHADAPTHPLFDAFVYPEAAIPHDAGHDAPLSPCSSLPDESSYCATPDGGGSSNGFYVCVQGNGIYSACSPGTVCVPTDAGAVGIACEKP